MTKLAEQHCVPCRGGVPPLKGAELIPYAEQLPDWKIVEEHHVAKSFLFADFKTGLDFVNRVGAVAEQEGHHPDLEPHRPSANSRPPHLVDRCDVRTLA